MTTLKMIEAVAAMLREHDAETGANFAEKIISDPFQAIPDGKSAVFYSAGADLLISLRKRLDAKNSSAKKRVSALLRYFNACPDTYPGFRGWVPVGDKWILCNGYSIIALNKKVESVPDAPSGGEDAALRLYDQYIFNRLCGNEKVVALPSVADLKAWISTHKVKNGKYVYIKPIEAVSGWWCNPKSLLDLLEVFPDAVAYKPANALSPINISGSDGEAALLPVRPPKSEGSDM